jgi:hypothetical protein
MPAGTAIAKLIMDRFFNPKYAIQHGPGLTNVAQFPSVREGMVQTVPEIPYIVPNEIYRPKIYVTMDFSHVFTADFSESTRVVNQRPVSAETVKRAAMDMKGYFDYYFEYVLSFGGKGRRSRLATLITRALEQDTEDDIILFMNYFLNFYLSSISVDKSVNDIGSATAVFRNQVNFIGSGEHKHKVKLFFDETFSILRQIFVPMVPIMIWARGRIYRDWYFPIFDGYITSINPSESGGGQDQVSLNCRDSLELARISQEMVNPSIIQFDEIVRQSNVNIFSQPLYGLDHLQIFRTMFLGGKLAYDPEQQRILPGNPIFEKSSRLNFMALGNYKDSNDVDPAGKHPDEVVEQEAAIHQDQFNLKTALEKTSHVKRPRYVMTWGTSITPYRIFSTTSPQIFTAEFTSRLDIIKNIADLVYFNFYVDGWGHICYHPMRLTNDFLLYDNKAAKPTDLDKPTGTPFPHKHIFPGVQLLGSEESFTKNNRINSEELITFLRVSGTNPFLSGTAGELVDLIGSAIDLEKMAKFGYRRRSVKNPLFNFNVQLPGKSGRKASFMDLVAKSLMQYNNAELHTTQQSIPFRPELQLARPIFNPYDRNVYYCQSMSHTVNINADATTSINGNYGRKEKEMPPDLYSFILLSEKIFELNGQIPPLSQFSTQEEVEEYYQEFFALDKIPFLDWVDDLVDQREMFDAYEKKLNELRSQDDTSIFDEGEEG